MASRRTGDYTGDHRLGRISRSGDCYAALSEDLSQLPRGVPQDLCQLAVVPAQAEGAAGGQKGLSPLPHGPVHPGGPPVGEPSGAPPSVVRREYKHEEERTAWGAVRFCVERLKVQTGKYVLF